MSDQYTVTMTRKQLVSKFDDKGNKIADNVIELPITFHDLPYVTAQSYRTKFPDANVKITLQAAEYRRERSTYEHKSDGKPRSERGAKPERVIERDTTVDAAMSGDMSAAVTTAVKDAAG